MLDFEHLLVVAKEAALQAGEVILEIYATGDFSIEAKSDNSPLTIADQSAHKKISELLAKTGIPILSEEGADVPYEIRKDWEYFWMVDPLDGTKEFIKKNGEFTVNIALIHRTEVVLGVVFTPVTNDLYWAAKGLGAYKNGNVITVNAFNLLDEKLKVVASRSHMNAETEDYLSALESPEIVSKGSSLKLLMIAEGSADLYPRFAPTMEWDIAASQIIVEEAGGSVLEPGSKVALKYNKLDLHNPFFLVTGNVQ